MNCSRQLRNPNRRSTLHIALFATLLFGVTSQLAFADAFSYSENFGFFGGQNNFSCGQQGACGAVGSINSFIFLDHQYPTVYVPNNTYLITPNYNANTNTDMVDAQNFGFNGFGTYQGYYQRTGSAYTDFINTLSDWFTNYAPGTTVLHSWYAGSNDFNRLPTIGDLAGEIKDQENVEFFVLDPNPANKFFHVLTLTGVACDAQNNCTIDYQDPNDPTNEYQNVAVQVVNGQLQIKGVLGDANNWVGITGEFSESPVPEPATLVTLGSAVLGLAGVLRRRFMAAGM